MTQLASDDVPESSNVGTARKARTVTARDAESPQEAPRTPEHHVAVELKDYHHDLPHDAERLGVGLEDDRKLFAIPSVRTNRMTSMVARMRKAMLSQVV